MAYNRERISGPVYVTKWGLTRGILVYDGGEILSYDDSDRKYFTHGNASHSCSDSTYVFVGENEFCSDREVALARVQAKAEKKLKALAKQQKKLNAVCNGEVRFEEVKNDD